MAESDTIIKVKTVADNSGADSAQKAHDKVAQSAQRAGVASAQSAQKAAGAWQRFSGAVSSAGKAIGTFTKALGFIGLALRTVETLVGWYEKLKGWLDRDKTAAEELNRKIQDKLNAKALESVAWGYERISKAIAEADRLEQQRQRNAATAQASADSQEDAKLELEEARAVAAVDENDPDRAAKQGMVRNEFARRRAALAASRATRDRVAEQNRLQGLADQKQAQAIAYEKDIHGASGEAVISLKGQVLDEKDPERKKSLQQQLEKLIAEQKKKKDAADKLRKEAAELREQSQALWGTDLAAITREETVGVQTSEADKEARRSIAAAKAQREETARRDAKKKAEKEAKAATKAAQEAADRETVASGRSKIEELEFTATHERDRASLAAETYTREQADVFNAQNRYDMLVANGGSRKDRSAALAALQKEQREAEEAKHEMERVAAQVANTLQGIHAQIKALASAVKKAEGRLAQNQADAPEG